MNKITIINEIESRVNKYYRMWHIGITDNPDERKSGHGNPPGWTVWKADSENDARSIEKNFLDKGMQGGDGGGKTPDHVYIFKA